MPKKDIDLVTEAWTMAVINELKRQGVIDSFVDRDDI